MWVDAVLIVALIVSLLIVGEALYRIGREHGYDAGYQAAVDLSYMGQVEIVAPWEHRPAVRDRDA